MGRTSVHRIRTADEPSGHVKSRMDPSDREGSESGEHSEPLEPAGLKHNKRFCWKKAALLALVSVMLYANSLDCELVFDDISAVKDNKDLRPSAPLINLLWNDFWGTPMLKENSHKSYRPFTVLTFRWNYALHGGEPRGYHLVNIALHALNSVLVYRCFLLVAGPIAAFVGALLFTVHPIHTEAVTGVVGRAELLSTAFALAVFIVYAECRKNNWKWNVLLPAGLLLALFSKEQGITIVAVCGVYQIFGRQEMSVAEIFRGFRALLHEKPKIYPGFIRAARRMRTLLLSSILLMAWRMKVMRGQLPVFTPFDNPASTSHFPIRQMTYLYLLPLNGWLLIFPWDLLCDYTMGTIPLVASVFDVRNLASVLFVVVMGKLVQKALWDRNIQDRVVLTMGLCWMVFPFLPASNLLFPVGFVVAERILYMPSIGFCLLLGFGYERLRSSLADRALPKVLFTIGMSALLLSFGCRSFIRNLDWKTEGTLFRAGLRITQSNAKIFNNVGHVLEKVKSPKSLTEALDFFMSAALAQPDDIGAWNNVGRTLNALNRTLEAEAAWRRAKGLLPQPKPGQAYQTRIAPQHLSVFLNLGNIMAKDPTRLEEADQIYRQAISMRSDYVEAYINRGDVLIKMNRSAEAIEVYQKALEIDNSNADIYYNMAVVFTEQGGKDNALKYFEKCLALNPDHQLALLNSAVLMGEMKNAKFHDPVQKRLERILELGDDVNAYFQLGMLYTDRGRPMEAEKYFLKTVEMKKDHKSGLFNIALLLNNRKESRLALPYLESLVAFYPDHTKGWILIGEIYINHLKDYPEAEKVYQRILSFDPTNFQAFHNLCVTLVEQGKIPEADQCMAQLAALMHHDTEYLATHFKTVHDRLEKRRNADVTSSVPVFN